MPVTSRRHAIRAAGTLSLGALLAACVAAPPPSPYPPVPPPRAEIVPSRRRPEEVFQPGHWQWNGRDYEWIPGHLLMQPARTARFVPGHWDARGGSWVWVPAHWA